MMITRHETWYGKRLLEIEGEYSDMMIVPEGDAFMPAFVVRELVGMRELNADAARMDAFAEHFASVDDPRLRAREREAERVAALLGLGTINYDYVD